MPPKVRILALRAIRPPGTNHGMHANSPALVETLQIKHGMQHHAIITEINRENVLKGRKTFLTRLHVHQEKNGISMCRYEQTDQNPRCLLNTLWILGY